MRRLLWILGATVLAFVLIQLIPYGRDHSLPPVNDEPQWPDAGTRELARRACFDCHSNETVWPWYSNIAPVSWLVYHDVTDGRTHINFSDWNRPERQHVNAFAEVFEKDSMPPAIYLLQHPEARLTETEKQQLEAGLIKLAQEYGK
jgi:hypothetical protein